MPKPHAMAGVVVHGLWSRMDGAWVAEQDSNRKQTCRGCGVWGARGTVVWVWGQEHTGVVDTVGRVSAIRGYISEAAIAAVCVGGRQQA